MAVMAGSALGGDTTVKVLSDLGGATTVTATRAGGLAGRGERHDLDVLLVAVGSPHPAAARLASRSGIPPLGIAYLAAVLRQRGIRVRIADLNVPGWTRERFKRCLELQRPKVVGLSCMTESYRNAIRLASWVRVTKPGIRLVAGGPHVTFEDAAALRTGVFDVVARGEGEHTCRELMPLLLEAGAGPVASIAGIRSVRGISFLERSGSAVGATRTEGGGRSRRSARPDRTIVDRPEDARVVRTEDRSFESDLDQFPWPTRDLLPMERYGSPGSLLTGRGCPGRCLFCAAAAMAGGRRRCRRPEAVIEEIAFLRASRISEIVFLDDTLTGDRQHLEDLLDGLERRRFRITWTCESRIEAMDPSLLRRMARLGCHGIQYGIESGSADSQRLLGKGASRGYRGILEATHRAGITPVCSMILGLPWEDEAAVRTTIETGLEIQREFLARVGFGVLVCFPGTPFWRRASRFGLRRRTGDFDQYTMHTPTCETRHLSRQEMRRLQFEATVRQIREMPRELIALSRFGLPVGAEGTAR